MGTMLGSFWRQITVKPKSLPEDLSLEACKEMIAQGLSRAILSVRNLEIGNAARNELLTSWPKCDVEAREVDYESFASMMAFGVRASKLDRLDIVILIVGVKAMKFSLSKTGHEMNVQRTAEATGASSRLTFVSSEVHFWTPFNEKNAVSILERLDSEGSFKKSSAMERYSTSKLLGVLWTRELPDKLDHKIIFMIAWSSTVGAHTLTNAVAYHDGQQGAYLSQQRVTSPSFFVTSAEGEKVWKKLWNESIQLFRKEVTDFELPNMLN
ncbi:short-chain dehydrogenase/reductase SDR [Xylaria arbuscula]|nr:short-chain dehydrogenase/reductase SDR [Xylaria arbuscula]